LIFFALLGYFFNKILSNDTNQFARKITNNSDLQLIKEKSKDKLKFDERKPEKAMLKSLNW
tara:strand:+ start:360 stop:542 length:183 start_codon:yes stop_codon:yes gene_type:complete